MIHAASRVVCATFLAGVLLALPPASAQTTFRHLSGTVTDQQHEPLSGAIVEVQNQSDNSITSYITDKSGHYDFRRLGSETDYSFWATYRNHRSHAHFLSKFNSKTAPVVDLVVKLD